MLQTCLGSTGRQERNWGNNLQPVHWRGEAKIEWRAWCRRIRVCCTQLSENHIWRILRAWAHQPLKVLTSWASHLMEKPPFRCSWWQTREWESQSACQGIRAGHLTNRQVSQQFLCFLCVSLKKKEITTRCLHRQHSYGCYAKKKWSAAVWSLFCELQSQNYVLFQESVVVLSRAVLPLDWVDTIKEALITQCLFHTLIVCSAKWNQDFVSLWGFVLRVNLKPIPLLGLQCCRDLCSNSQN